METTTTPANDGSTYLPITRAAGSRFIQALHVPSQAHWWQFLTGCAWLSQQNSTTIIDPKVVPHASGESEDQ